MYMYMLYMLYMYMYMYMLLYMSCDHVRMNAHVHADLYDVRPYRPKLSLTV